METKDFSYYLLAIVVTLIVSILVGLSKKN